MQPRTYALAVIALVVLILAPAHSWAAAPRTFVASYGNDANPCSLTLPCRGFAAAVTSTTAGGEVVVLDSAGYGPVVITHPVSITAPSGVYAGITVTSGIGIAVDPGPDAAVVLTGLTINGQGLTDSTGISFISGYVLRIERTTVTGVYGAGLYATSSGGTLIVHDSAFVQNRGGLSATTASVLRVDIDRTRLDQNSDFGADLYNVMGVITASTFNGLTTGVFATASPSGATNVTFRNCVFASAGFAGILAGGVGSGPTVIQVTDSEIVGNSSGVQAQAGSTVNLSNTTITRNSTGINLEGGTVKSFQDNRLYGNQSDGTFTSTIGKL